MVKNVKYFVVSDIASYNELKEECNRVKQLAEAVVPSNVRFERLGKDTAGGLAKVVTENPIEGVLILKDIDFDFFLLGANEVASTDLFNLELGKGKDKKFYFCDNNDGNREWKRSKSVVMQQDLRDGLFVPGPTGYFDYDLKIQSLQHRILTHVMEKSENPDCPDMVVFFRVLPRNFAGVLDRHATRSDADQHVMASEEMFSLEWLKDVGFEKCDKKLATALSKLFATVASFVHARTKGYGYHPSKAQSPSCREYLQFVDECEGGLEAFKATIAESYQLQFGDDGKPRWWNQTPKVNSTMIAVLGILASSIEKVTPSIPGELEKALIGANELGTDPISQLFNELRRWEKEKRKIDDRLVFHALVRAYTDLINGASNDHYYPKKVEEDRIKEKKLSLARLPGVDSMASVETEE